MEKKPVFEEKLNILLSELLNQMGVISHAEQLGHGRRDIVVYHQGLEIVLEGSYSRTDAEKDAKKRIGQLACDVAIAIHYPKTLFQDLTDSQIKEKLKKFCFSTKIINPDDIAGSVSQFLFDKNAISEPTSSWQECDLTSLSTLIRQIGQFIISEQHIKEIETKVNDFIEVFINSLSSDSKSKTIVRNLYNILYKLYGFSIGDPEEIKEAIFAQAGLAILLSAIYYETIRYAHNLKSLDTLRVRKGSLSAIKKATKDIYKIDYQPIFESTKEMLPNLPQRNLLFNRLIDLSVDIASKKSLLRRDIAGKIYHRIVGDWSVRKGLATYYTQIPAAYLLLHLAKPKLCRICDFACGSGTLLVAAYSAINSNYRFSLLKKIIDKSPDKIEEEFHRKFIESCHGFDVLKYATQITALNLAFHSPATPLKDFCIYTLPLGYRTNPELVSLGSLEVARTEGDFMQKFEAVTKMGIKERKEESLLSIISNLGLFDLITMNPPFTRATGRGGREGSGLFGFVADENTRRIIQDNFRNLRKEIKSKLEEIGNLLSRKENLSFSLNEKAFQTYKNIGQAGEGLLFLYLAHKKVKENGKICFVLPKSFLCGISWFLARCLLAYYYHIEYIVVSYDSDNGYNFSESTSLSECLFVAKKVKQHSPNEETKFIVLLNKPKTSIEGISLARLIEKKKNFAETGDARAFILRNSREEMLEYIDNWGRFVFLPHLKLLKNIKDFLRGSINIGNIKAKIPITRLNNLISSIGIDAHQFHDEFTITSKKVPGSTKILLGGEEAHRLKMVISPSDYALPTTKGESLYREKAGTLLLPDRIRLTTAHILSMISDEPILSNIFYTIKLRGETKNKLKALCTYINTSWGILSVLANREETEGAWIRLKMSQWRLLPVLDISELSKSKINKLAKLFDKFSNKELKRIPEQYGTRGEIDILRIQLDLEFLKALGISGKENDLIPLYEDIGSSLKQWIGG